MKITTKEIETLKLKDLKEYENNTKLHTETQVEHIANSIVKLGYNDLIEVDENNEILSGHGRYQALKKLNYDEVKVCRIKGMTEDEKKAYRIITNTTNLETQMDFEKLDLELNLIELDTEDLGIFKDDIEIENIDDDFDSLGKVFNVKKGFMIMYGCHRKTLEDKSTLEFYEQLKKYNNDELYAEEKQKIEDILEKYIWIIKKEIEDEILHT